MPEINGKAVEGIKYPSSVASGAWSAVLFATQRNVLGIECRDRFEELSDRWVQLISVISG